jgi:hypothetical protein
MGGKSSQSNNTDQAMAINNAWVAQQLEADRRSRLKQGMSRIDGAFKGFDDNYYANFATANNEYNMPQAEKQYKDATDELTFRHARAGTLNSSMSATNTANLAKQNQLGRAQVLNMGDQAAANLRNRVASEKQAVMQQLYATEDPDMAANAALTGAKNIGQDQPSMSPLGALFSVPIVGASNFMQGYNTGQAYKAAGFGGNSPSGGGFGNSSRFIG